MTYKTVVDRQLDSVPQFGGLFTQVAADGLPATARRYAGGSVSVALHLGLALILLYRFHPISSSPSRPETISLLDLGSTGAGRDLNAQAEIVLDHQSEAEPDVAKPKVELDVSKALEPSPTWPVSEPGAPQPHRPAASAGGPSYDPYAGSAPYQQGEASYRLSVTSGSGISATAAPAESQLLSEPIKPSPFYLDERAFRDLRRDLERSLDGVTGDLIVRVRLSSDGIVTEAKAKDSSFSPAETARLTAAIVGRSLFFLREPTAATAVIDLPKLKLRS